MRARRRLGRPGGARARRVARSARGLHRRARQPRVARGARRARAGGVVARSRRRDVRRARAGLPSVSRSRRRDRRRARRGLARWDYWAFRGESAVANGWLQRARRLLEHGPPSAERAWLEVREGSLCLYEDYDPDRAHALASEGVRIAREAGSIDMEMLGRAVQGLALVMSGAVAEGMRALDEVNAAVVAGEMHDFVAIALSCCYMVAACEHVRDYDRAVQWCTRLQAFCAKWGCGRSSRSAARSPSICMWRGTWLEAEQELSAAAEELEASRPAMTADALVRLGELRRRRDGWSTPRGCSIRRTAIRWRCSERAELACDRGEARAAAELAARYLRRLPPQNESRARTRAAGPRPRGRRRSRRRANGVRGAVRDRGADADRTAARDGEPRGRLDRAGGGRGRRGAPSSRGCGRSLRAERRAIRDRRGAARAGAGPGATGRRSDAALEARRAVDLLVELKAEFQLAQARELLASLSGTPADAPPPHRRGADGQRDRSAPPGRRGPQQPGDRRAAVRQRAHRPPSPGEHLQQAQCLIARGRRRAGRPPRPPAIAALSGPDGPRGPFSPPRTNGPPVGRLAHRLPLSWPQEET